MIFHITFWDELAVFILGVTALVSGGIWLVFAIICFAVSDRKAYLAYTKTFAQITLVGFTQLFLLFYGQWMISQDKSDEDLLLVISGFSFLAMIANFLFAYRSLSHERERRRNKGESQEQKKRFNLPPPRTPPKPSAKDEDAPDDKKEGDDDTSDSEQTRQIDGTRMGLGPTGDRNDSDASDSSDSKPPPDDDDCPDGKQLK
ncbi:MAG: hypothetical protein WC477_05755 [Patescibacteria group bacterium]